MTGTWTTWRSSPPQCQDTRQEAPPTDASWAPSHTVQEKYSSSMNPTIASLIIRIYPMQGWPEEAESQDVHPCWQV